MTAGSTLSNDYNEIARLVGLYIEGARTGESKGMRAAFAEGAVMCGLMGPNNYVTPIGSLFSFIDGAEPSPDISATIRSIYISGVTAITTVDIKNWGGTKYEDTFVALKTDGGWKISSKTYQVV